ncbi:MAG TPA: FHA domain-containing protein, partial [Gammaproteobacteria bacterium]|nr:FHA domain-containing protein [Gammaproteobacteria bacterium]
LYCDATLRTVTVTRVEQSGAAVHDRFETSEGAGLAAFTDEMVRAIAHRFVLETRFDPLHDAGTEQALYDGLPGWLDALHHHGIVNAQLEHAGKEIAVELTTERVRSASLRLFREIAQLIGSLRTPGVPAVVQLHSRLARLPGLLVELARLDGVELTALEHGAPARFALQRVAPPQANVEEVRLLRRLPFLRDAQPTRAEREPAPRAAARAISPTHVVFDGIVYRLDQSRVEIANVPPTRRANGTRTIAIGGEGSAADAAHCVLERGTGGIELVCGAQEALFVNGERVTDRRRLAVGDVIRIGESSAELQIVAMEP